MLVSEAGINALAFGRTIYVFSGHVDDKTERKTICLAKKSKRKLELR